MSVVDSEGRSLSVDDCVRKKPVNYNKEAAISDGSPLLLVWSTFDGDTSCLLVSHQHVGIDRHAENVLPPQ